MKRVFLAGLLGGIAMFVWTSVAHMILPLGATGVQELPNEAVVLSTLHSALGETSGLYLFPGFGVGPDATRQQQREAMQHYQVKLDANPSGLLVYHPPGAKSLTGKQLATEFFAELIEAIIVVFLLAQTRLSTFASRVGFVVLAGLMAAITTNISYWNWYGFPSNYSFSYMCVEIFGYLIVGLVAAFILKNVPTMTAVA
jgi:hypothetical protein